jgi:hypothetical protein
MHAQNVHVRIALAVGVIAFAIAAVLGLAAITLPAPAATRGLQTLYLRADTPSDQHDPRRAHAHEPRRRASHQRHLGQPQRAAGGNVRHQLHAHRRLAPYTLGRCDGWGHLTGGQLTIAGISRSNSSHATWAITGGTGSYQTARGEIHLDQLNNHQTAVTVTLAGL